MSRLEAETHENGATARNNGQPKIPPSSLNWQWRHWWLAGYDNLANYINQRFKR